MFLYLTAAKGWCTTRLNLEQGTWRLHVVLSFGFYVVLTMFVG